MFGMFRFFLAVLVAVEHMLFIKGIYPGVIAVTCFYMLAGYVMVFSFEKNFSGELKNVGRFYVDRVLRIYPMYWIASLLVLGLVVVTGAAEVNLTFFSVTSFMTLLPLNYWMFLPQVFSLNNNSFPLPPAPSLALEFHFYLICPFVILWPPLRHVLIFLSLYVFYLAGVGRINTYFWGYSLLPGTLYLFLSGIYLYEVRKRPHDKLPRIILIAVSAVLFGLLLYFAHQGDLTRQHTFEIIVGFFIAIVAIHVLGPIKSESKLDDYLGRLSYPLFISHFLVLWLFNRWLVVSGVQWDPIKIAVYKMSFILLLTPLIYHGLDVPFQKIRKRMQSRSKLPSVKQRSHSAKLRN